jgi:hypothetical protein
LHSSNSADLSHEDSAIPHHAFHRNSRHREELRNWHPPAVPSIQIQATATTRKFSTTGNQGEQQGTAMHPVKQCRSRNLKPVPHENVFAAIRRQIQEAGTTPRNMTPPTAGFAPVSAACELIPAGTDRRSKSLQLGRCLLLHSADHCGMKTAVGHHHAFVGRQT